MVDRLENTVSKFAEQYGIDITSDTKFNPDWIPQLAKLNENGTTEQHISKAGANYTYSQIDYYKEGKICASRTIAIILPGNRTELVYWTKSAPSQKLSVNQGQGKLIIGYPKEGRTKELQLDSKKANEVILPSACFYTIKATKDSIQQLVVSSLYGSALNWDEIEIPLNSEQTSVKVPAEGIIQVPPGFLSTSNS